jgi:hypothetical protein
VPKMRSLLHRKSKIETEEAALAETRVAERLANMFGVGPERPAAASPVEMGLPDALTWAPGPDALAPSREPTGVDSPGEAGASDTVPEEDPGVRADAEIDDLEVPYPAADSDVEIVRWELPLPDGVDTAQGPDPIDVAGPEPVAVATSDIPGLAAGPAAAAVLAPAKAPAVGRADSRRPASSRTRPTPRAVAVGQDSAAAPKVASAEEVTAVQALEPAQLAAAGRPASARRIATGAKPAGSTPGRGTVRRKTAKKAKPSPASPAFCPYCAQLLQPAPASSRRCDRCRQRIVVKRVDGRAVYLTEAALPVFEAERQRLAGAGRFMRERDRWLRLAASVEAPADRAARLAAAAPCEDVVKAARTLYLGTVDRAFRTAKHDHEWNRAARLRREQAAALFRIAGSPSPPPADILAMFREGVEAELRGIAELAREAEVVSSSCCDACRADDRKSFRISAELRGRRLPHDGCPKGLCRCRWGLAARDRTTMRQLMRRRARPEPQAVSGESTPGI